MEPVKISLSIGTLGSFTIAMFGILFDRENLYLLSPIWTLPVQLVSSLSLSQFFIFFYLFPNGHFVPRWTRWLAVASFPYWLADIFFPIWGDSVLNFAIFLGFTASMLGTQVYRYKKVSSLRERQQTKWVILGAIVGLGGYFTLFTVLAIFLGSSSYDPSHPPFPLLLVNTVISTLLLLFPFSIGFAILRSRLWDIDIIINRTLVYGTLTILLVLVYFGLIFGLQYLLRGIISQNNDVAIVVSTLAIAALFQPLRHRIQEIIDRHFYRRKYDAAKIVETFSATLRNEVDLNQLREHLLNVVQETIQPAHVSLWLRPNQSYTREPHRLEKQTTLEDGV